MKVRQLDEMIGGWFIGNFDPHIFKSDDVEVAVKSYEAGHVDEAHYHKVATEITCIIEGSAEMCGQTLKKGDIIRVEPNEINLFKALTDVTVVSVKLPAAPDDKYLIKED